MNPNSLSPKVLKERLEALPARREAAEQGDRFERFREQAAAARSAATQAHKAAEIAAQVLDDSGYREVLSRVGKAARRAASLRDRLLKDVAVVTADETGKVFATLSQMSTGALDLCKTTWKRTIETKLRGRAVLIEKLPSHVLGNVGSELRETIAALQRECMRPPTTPTDADRVRGLLSDFDKLVQRLQLEGLVGTFLQALATDRGASLELLKDEAICSFLNEYQLWGAFRVKLP
jgi:hypothetical protein